MSAATAPRTRTGGSPPAPPPDRRRRAVSAALVLVGLLAAGLVAATLLRTWLGGGLDDPTGAGSAPGSAQGGTAATLPLGEDDGDGRLDVVDVHPELMTHPEGMPEGMMPDPVPAGMRRVTLELEVVAGDAPLPYDLADLRLTPPGAAPAVPIRGSLGAGEVPAGARVAGSALFEVPLAATTAELSLEGGSGSVEVALPDHEGHAGYAGHAERGASGDDR